MTAVSRIHNTSLHDKVISAEQAAAMFTDNMVVASSGFTKAGDSKAVLNAFAHRVQEEPMQITLVTGASLGHGTDGLLAKSGALSLRFPFQVDSLLRESINKGDVFFIDQHLGETAELLKNGHFPKIDIAIIEATLIEQDGSIVPTTSVGNSAVFAQLAGKVIIEINTRVPLALAGVHDIFMTGSYRSHAIIPVTSPEMRIGSTSIAIDPEKIAGIVITDIVDSPAEIALPDASTKAIAAHLLTFFNQEVEAGRLTQSLLPLQAGIGKVANAVLHGFIESDFEALTMYSEVLQDSTFDLFDSGKLLFASGSSITVSGEYYERIFADFDRYKDKIRIRPQDVTNAAEVIRRLGIIAINTAIECDIYGNVNSSHIGGSNMMNGIGGSGDFARNSYLSVFVTQSAGKGNTLSRIVPMVTHVDHTEHDVDIIVTEQGLADLRGLAPRQRAKAIIENCAHPDFRQALTIYFEEACERGGHTPHVLEKAFSWHTNLAEFGTMKPVDVPANAVDF
ncbi:propionyl-CoA--succinate CoA transferase [Dyadobacter luteus]|jgi:succinyl-CoA:acetate CoA-transferase|uniref:Propionyl-CoA--succinate CoA transferase n=1 Tax=Dyadobacter luteus TaxID=2259619 RepID=A0A3D8YFX7_9BACT|nr:succinate CoA transferase [Dyadobacter luteus]REA63177.1 propionyl-CoA--succinate CoA transferase [Dyadobacter luteus]